MKNELGEIKLQLETTIPPNQGVFYDGQIFDAYVFVSDLIITANVSILLIDNYIDESVLVLLGKLKLNVSAIIYTKKINKQLELDLEKYNKQYPEIIVKQFSKSHDRFLIIDNKTIFHIGASLKDVGKTWFAFSKMNINAIEMLSNINKDDFSMKK